MKFGIDDSQTGFKSSLKDMCVNNPNVAHDLTMPLQANDGVAVSAHILLRRLFRILRGCGLSLSQLQSISDQALNEVQGIPDAHASRVTARQAFMCCDVVLKWRRDCKYLDKAGLPMQLSINGASPSFIDLVKAATPDANPHQLLAAMEELGVVRIAEDAKAELISESVVACAGREGSTIASECVLEHICGFLGSVEYNVFDKPSRERGRFERACYASVPLQLVPVLEQLVSARGQDFVDVIDEWLARRAIKRPLSDDLVLVGAGAYVFVRKHD
ncbi:MAG: DUF6502 family protein [Steroidobacteraceae bacterium]